MAFYYRKSVNLGPFRVNLSKSGLGYSVGGRGFRVGTTAHGKKYTSFSIRRRNFYSVKVEDYFWGRSAGFMLR